MTQMPSVMWFEDLGRGDVALVGGKNASLGEISACGGGRAGPGGVRRHRAGLSAILDSPGLREVGDRVRCSQDPEDAVSRSDQRSAVPFCAVPGRTTSRGRSHVLPRALPTIRQGRCGRGGALERHGGGPARGELRRTAGDLPQHPRRDALLDACRRCYASLFTDRAITYRQAKGFDHMKVALSIGVQQMVRSDLGGAGVMFSIDTETGFDKVVLINAAWGLGENVVQGTVDPDEYQVFKPLLGRSGADADRREEARRQGAEDDLRHGRRPADPQRADLEGRARSVRAERRGDPARWPVGRSPSSSTTAARWTWSGPRTARPASMFIVQARPETVQSRREAGALQSYAIRSARARMLRLRPRHRRRRRRPAASA